MDFVYHGLVGLAISKSFGGTHPIPAAVSAMLPDIIGIIPFYYFKLIEAKHQSDGWFPVRVVRRCMSNAFTNRIDSTIYRSTHSLLSVIVFAGLSYIYAPGYWAMLTLSYLSHIIIDIPTHEGDFATRLLYPFSSIHVPAYNWARHPEVFFGFWAVLGGVYFFT